MFSISTLSYIHPEFLFRFLLFHFLPDLPDAFCLFTIQPFLLVGWWFLFLWSRLSPRPPDVSFHPLCSHVSSPAACCPLCFPSLTLLFCLHCYHSGIISPRPSLPFILHASFNFSSLLLHFINSLHVIYHLSKGSRIISWRISQTVAHCCKKIYHGHSLSS